MKKFIALVLSLVMALSLCAPAWAAGGKLSGDGSAENPFIIEDAADLTAISDKYDTYAYYKVADDVEILDLTGVGRIYLNGSFDGNGVEIVNLTTALFERVGKVGDSQKITISNMDVTVNTTDGRALVRNIYNKGETTFENVTMHGYIEGQSNIGSFYNYGTANGDSKGADYTVTFKNATSDVTLVCTTGNAIGGMLGHGYEGADNTLFINMDDASGYTGEMYTTGSATCYQVMAMCSHATYMLNGVETSRYENKYESTKLAVAAPFVDDDGYYVAPAAGVDHYVVYVNAQMTAYDETGVKIPNKAGLTWSLDKETITSGFDGKIFDLVTSAEIVNDANHEIGYELNNNGLLTIYTGRDWNYASGWITLNVNQYDADGEILATGNLEVYRFAEPEEFYTVSFDANGGSGEMDSLARTDAVKFTLPENGFTAPEGKYFKGWAASADGAVITDTLYAVTGNETLYAIWEDITYSVSFDANGASGEMAGDTVVVGTVIELPECAFTAPVGKQFKAWSVDGAEYAAGEKITVAADVTVTAVWEYIPVVEPDVEDEDIEPTVEVLAPEVSVNTEGMTETEKTAANEVAETLKEGNAVEISSSALTSEANKVAQDVAENTETIVTEEHVAALDSLTQNATVTADDVVVTVQTYFDVQVADVVLKENSSEVETVTLEITPMYQLVATTEAVVNDDNTEIKTDGEDKNAVKVGEPETMKLDKPTKISVVLPDAFKDKVVYITHEAEKGVVLYKANADANGKLTFMTKSGFSPFTFSLNETEIAATIEGGDDYADLKSALNYAGKGAVIEVKKSGEVVDITTACSFKLKLADGVDEPTFNVAEGYTMSKWYVNGVYTYIVQNASAGGYAPVAPSTPEKVVTSADTFDAGIALYVGMSVMAAAGSAVVLKKRED